MRIRKAQLADKDQVFILTQEFTTSFDIEKSSFQISFQHLIDDTHALMLIAEEHNQIIGYCLGFEHETLFANGNVAWVEEITVSPFRRQQGIGRLLMTSFENWASDRNVKLIALATRRASEFYGALGYEESATYFRKLL